MPGNLDSTSENNSSINDDLSTRFIQTRKMNRSKSDRSPLWPRARLKNSRWTPTSLHTTNLVLLVTFLLLYVLALELIKWKLDRMQGLDVGDKVSVQALQYVPTVVAILIGFAWKALSTDLVLVTPWAAMSGKWAEAKDSILLNYADSLDIVSVWTSFKHGHWGLCLVLLCGLLSGLLVPLANALTYTDLNAFLNETATISLANDFVFNGSLGIPPGWHTAELWQNYLTVPVDDSTFSSHFPWLFQGYALPAPDTRGMEGSILTATVDAFSASLECSPIIYGGRYRQVAQNSSFELSGREDTVCDRPVSQTVLWPWNSSTIQQFTQNSSTGYFDIPPSFWLNITQCGNNSTDYRILATTLAVDIPNNLTTLLPSNGTANYTNSSNVWTADNIGVRAGGFICSPSYWSTSSIFQANITTGLVGAGPWPIAAPKQIENVGVGLDVIQAAMNNPIDPYSQLVFQAAATNNWSLAVLPNSYNWSQFSQLEVMQRNAWIYLYATALTYDAPPTDPFFAAVLNDNITAWNFFNNQSMLKEAVENRFAIFVPMLVDVAARAAVKSTVPGTLSSSVPKLLIRFSILRAVEATLLVLTLAGLIVFVFVRPSTLLSEHPGSLRYVALVLANSPLADETLEGLGACDEKQLMKHLENTSCRLSTTDDGEAQLEFCHTSASENSTLNRGAAESERSESFLMRSNAHSLTPRKTMKKMLWNAGDRYRPLALRFGSRILIPLALVAVAVGAGVSLHISDRLGGYNASTASTSAWDLVPSIILVSIGYSIQSMEHAALNLSAYKQLATNSFRSRYAMVRRQVQDASKAILINRTYEWSIVSFACVGLLLTLPALKLMAGKLFIQTYGSTNVLSSFPANVSKLEQLNKLASYVTGELASQWTNAWQETVFTQTAQTRPIEEYFDKIGLLYLSVIDYNLTSLLDGPPLTAQSDLLESRLMAVNTSVTCSAIDPSGVGLFLKDCTQNSSYTFEYGCITSECRGQIGQALSQLNVSITVAPDAADSGDSQIPYFSATFPSIHDDSISVLIADFTALIQDGLDYSQLKCSNESLSPALGKYMPTFRAVNCTRQLNLVHANVTFTRAFDTSSRESPTWAQDPMPMYFQVSRKIALYAFDQQYDWSPISYDVQSLELIAPVIAPGDVPAPVLIPDTGVAIYHTGRTPAPLLSPYSFSGLLQQLQEMRTGNQLDLLDVSNLMSVTQSVYESFTMVALERTFGEIYSGLVIDNAPAIAPVVRNYTAKFTLYKPAVRQDTDFTIALIALVGASCFAVTLLSLTLPRSTLLPKAPNSIAAQMSILAGSNLVSVLRRSKEDGKQSDVFEKETFGLGWWPLSYDKHGSSGDGVPLIYDYRWGVDIGQLPEDNRKLKSRPKVGTPSLPFDSSYDTPSARHSFFHQDSSSSTSATAPWAVQKKEPRVATSSYKRVPSLNIDEMDPRSWEDSGRGRWFGSRRG